MAINNNPPKKEEKSGFLALGLKVGDPVPELEEVGVSSRIDEKGLVEWKSPIPLDVLDIINKSDLQSYMHKKNANLVHTLFRISNAMIRAKMGLHVASGGERPIDMPPIQPLQQWEEAPRGIQSMLLKSLQEYLSPQLKKSNA